MQQSLSEKRKLAHGWFGGAGLPRGWQWIKLGNACEINPRRPKGFDRADDKPTTFIPMGAVNATCGMVDRPQTCPYREIKKGYTFFSDGDVLFAKITPCMQNGKHFIAGNSLDGVGFASTEFHVLRPGDSLLAEWVHFYLRQPAILKEATYHFTGTAGQQRVPDSFLKELSIPSPSLPEQKRVVAVLNKQMAAVEGARGAALERVEAVRALPSAWLREVFSFGGSGLPRGWRWTTLNNVCIEDRCAIDGKSDDASVLPYLSLENIESVSGKIVFHAGKTSNSDIQVGVSTCFRFGPEHVLYGKLRPYLNKVALPDFSGRCTTEAIPILPKPEINREFLAWTLRRRETVDWAMAERTGSRMPRTNMKHLMSFKFPLPPLAEQERLVSVLNAKMAATEKVRAAAEAALEAITALPAALLREAFSGAL